MITYEFPYNERVRTLLRLENLMLRCLHFKESEDCRDHLQALLLLLELTDVTSRQDIRRDIMQDLEHARQYYGRFHDNPEIEPESLEGLLSAINEIYRGLQVLPGPMGHHIRNNEWLSSIRKRASLPGGICEFDLPSYHFWANLSPESRQADLEEWLKPFMPLHKAVSLILALLRDSSNPQLCLAKGGLFQQTGNVTKVAQMLRIHVPNEVRYMPEIVANKHLLQIRFTQPDFYALHPKSRQATEDILFDISICTLL